MDEQRNLSKREISVEQMKNAAKSADVLSTYFRKWVRMFPNQPIGREVIACYLEALVDLSPEQIEAGCREAIKTAEVFPKPGHIRAAVPFEMQVFLGPPKITYPEISQEEREDALKFSEALRTVIAKERIAHPATKTASAVAKKLKIKPSQLTIEQQKEILKQKGYL